MSEAILPIDRVFDWNEKRYDRVYDNTLCVSLLKEEVFDELFKVSEPVELLDALMDTAFVAVGGLWKLNLSEERLDEVLFACGDLMEKIHDICPWNPEAMLPAYIYMLENKIGAPEANLALIMNSALTQATGLGLSNNEVMEAFTVVCDSNDSKSIPTAKVDPSVKANVDKGAYFIPPEPRLQAILDNAKTVTHEAVYDA